MMLIPAARAALFYLGYIVATIIWGSLSVAIAWSMPPKARFSFVIGAWTRFVLWWLSISCGIRVQVRGREHLPDTPCILLVKHQSTWDTLFAQTLLSPQTTLIKRELLWIPFFGWAFSLLKPIAINRHARVGAFRQLMKTGAERMAAGFSVTLFPEGTRMPWGKQGRFHPGGAALASTTGAPVVVVAHDGGRYWPAHRFMKNPGTIEVRISPPIETKGEKAQKINELAEKWLRCEMSKLERQAPLSSDVQVDH
ncbi:MAG: lysophospholipid acyltransferase family protein [Gammaproteobacteria bacterium]|nr:lysophospholipid acyltransferase family protein [Gammaproteobacteria bacterium]